MIRLTLPGIFWHDHYERCGFGGDDYSGDGVVIRDNSNGAGRGKIVVELNKAALDDLLSDAEYYSDGVDFAGERAAYGALIRSAKATVRAIKRQTAT